MMKKIIEILVCLLFSLALIHPGYAQKTDSSKTAKDNGLHIYFIITAGDEINAYYNDKPLQLSTLDEFNSYVQTNVKSLRDSWVVVTGKPKSGTYDEVMKTLKRNRFRHISTNIKD